MGCSCTLVDDTPLITSNHSLDRRLVDVGRQSPPSKARDQETIADRKIVFRVILLRANDQNKRWEALGSGTTLFVTEENHDTYENTTCMWYRFEVDGHLISQRLAKASAGSSP